MEFGHINTLIKISITIISVTITTTDQATMCQAVSEVLYKYSLILLCTYSMPGNIFGIGDILVNK